MKDKHILVADDIFSNQLLVKSIIESAGFPCKVVTDGQKIINELTHSDQSYAAVFTDIEMPVMNGIETVKYIREVLKSDIPVIAMTAHARGEFMDKVKDAGFTAIVTKPYSVDKFKSILAYYTKENNNKKQ